MEVLAVLAFISESKIFNYYPFARHPHKTTTSALQFRCPEKITIYWQWNFIHSRFATLYRQQKRHVDAVFDPLTPTLWVVLSTAESMTLNFNYNLNPGYLRVHEFPISSRSKRKATMILIHARIKIQFFLLLIRLVLPRPLPWGIKRT